MELSKTVWRKVLYERQPFPDNHAAPSRFLEKMEKNVYTRTYNFSEIFHEVSSVSQQISSVFLFIGVFSAMRDGWLEPSSLVLVTITLVSVLYLLGHFLHSDTFSLTTGYDDVRTTGLLQAYLYGLSPLLKTLTESISTDTIYAMTAVMLIAHLLVLDYGARPSVAIVSQPLSMNTAVFAAVCLASRLPSAWHTYTTVSAALALLVFLPAFCKRMKDKFPASQVHTTLFLVVVSTSVLASISQVASVWAVILQLTVNFLCPYCFYRLQRLKNNIHGPWDEALPQQH